MILAAGRGERMRPLTDHKPKPLLVVGGRPLIEYHLIRLALVGITEVVINVAYLGEQIKEYLGDSFTLSHNDLCQFRGELTSSQEGSEADKKAANKGFSLSIVYSEEPEPLETAGAILHALPLLGAEPFLLVNGDVWTDYPFESLLTCCLSDSDTHFAESLAHIVLVENPEHNTAGDFSISYQDVDKSMIDESLDANCKRSHLQEKNTEGKAYTFSGISVINPQILVDYPDKREKFPLVEVLRFGITHKQISAEVYRGQWRDIGTIERLQLLDKDLIELGKA